jgi:hypothetical protein
MCNKETVSMFYLDGKDGKQHKYVRKRINSVNCYFADAILITKEVFMVKLDLFNSMLQSGTPAPHTTH